MRYFEAFIVILACIGSLYLGANIVALDPSELGAIVALILVIIWAFSAGTNWWTPILAGATMVGVFKFGIKVYPLEVSILLAIIALAPLLALGNEQVLQSQRKPLPLIFYLAAFYITVRFSIDIVPASGSRGNLGRVYFEAIWPFIFGWLFHRYGNLSALPVAVISAYVILILRCAFALAGFFINSVLYIPGINYVLSFSQEDSLIPLRFLASSLFLFSLLLYNCTKSFILKLMFVLFMAGSITLLVLGASRVAVVLMLMLPIAFCVWSRKWIILLLAASAIIGTVIFVNVAPRALEQLPDTAQRSLSGMIFTQRDILVVQKDTSGSDEWHSMLREEGYRRWSDSMLTVLFGYGIRPSPEIYETNLFHPDIQTLIGSAANTASYESALWSVLASIGLVGLSLYILLFFYFWKQVLPYVVRKPVGTLREGLIFWGVYGSFMWILLGYVAGGFPSLEILILLISAAIVQDDQAKKIVPKTV